jgi:hypothetical protein
LLKCSNIDQDLAKREGDERERREREKEEKKEKEKKKFY